MRRIALCAAASASLLVAACGDDDGSTSDTRITAPASSSSADDSSSISSVPSSVGATDATKPAVQIPPQIPTQLTVTVITPGEGRAAAAGDMVVVDYVGVRSETGEEFDNSYDSGEPFTVELGAGRVIKGWDQGLVGAQAGSRIQIDIPNELAYGDEANGVIQPGDALSFVIDVRAVLDPAAMSEQPQIDPLTSSGATELSTEDLVDGAGAEAVAGGVAIIHALIVRGDTGEVVNSTWGGQPLTLRLTSGATIEPLVEGLPGARVGGRRAITAPPSMVEPSTLESLGVPADTDLIFVIDVLAAY